MFLYMERKTPKNRTVIFMCAKKDYYASMQIDKHKTAVLQVRGHLTHLQLMDSEVKKTEVSQIKNFTL